MPFRSLYYITHIENIPSILKYGILSHERIESEGISFIPIYDKKIISRRKEITTPNGKSLWSFANLYFQPRNAMLYRVWCEKSANSIAVLEIVPDPLYRKDVFVTDGNAARHETKILEAPITRTRDKQREFLKFIDHISKIEWWTKEEDSKRQSMAECLVPNKIDPTLITSIYVANPDIAENVRKKISPLRIPVSPEPHMFFEPDYRIALSPKLSIVHGDMFFSRLQTLTISVNCVKIMGKGLASRAKYQFPRVYVKYQDFCRDGKLRLGKPVLLKLKYSLDKDLADEPESLTCANGEAWFLLFATKKHWRDRADIDAIEKGLQWILDNYKEEGIESLAIPALGCGLGWLDWKDVGPLMCSYLYYMDIPVEIYLPREKPIKKEFLTKEFLLRDVGRGENLKSKALIQAALSK
jgi:O-acetyl-ADP-ribose deacetylase (regulator of RNase III)